MNACWTGCSAVTLSSFFCFAYHAGNPSSVVTDLPWTAETGVTQDRTSSPFTSTEHEPHCASPQPKRGPCRCSSSDRTYSKGVSGAAVISPARSFTRILTSPAIVRTSCSQFKRPSVNRLVCRVKARVVRVAALLLPPALVTELAGCVAQNPYRLEAKPLAS